MRRANALIALTAVALLGCSTPTAETDGGGAGCVHASDCAGRTSCIAGSCVATTACTSSRMCPGLLCDPARMICVECVADIDCVAPDQRCRAGVCETAVRCAGDRDCSAMGEVCNRPTSTCVECNMDTDCAGSFVCRPDHSCGPRPDAGMPIDGGADDARTDAFVVGDALVAGMDAFVDDAAMASGGVVEVSAGTAFSCARRASGEVYCWGGQPTYGNLGDGGPDARPTAGPAVSGLMDARAISSGANHTCALRASATLVCWGYDSWGMLGNGMTTFAIPTPVPVAGVSGVTAVGGAAISTCASDSTGSVRCWGSSRSGQIGDGTFTDPHPTPAYVLGLSSITGLGPGYENYCARRRDGAVFCWGDNVGQALGTGPGGARATAMQVPGVTADEVATSQSYACARAGGVVTCWGQPPGTTSPLSAPIAIPGITDAVQIAAGLDVACVRRASGTVSCWGSNVYGQLGVGTMGTTTTSAPIGPVSNLSDAVDIAAGQSHVCAARATGDVVCWGWNMFGQLGDATMVPRAAPVSVMGLPAH